MDKLTVIVMERAWDFDRDDVDSGVSLAVVERDLETVGLVVAEDVSSDVFERVAEGRVRVRVLVRETEDDFVVVLSSLRETVIVWRFIELLCDVLSVSVDVLRVCEIR